MPLVFDSRQIQAGRAKSDAEINHPECQGPPLSRLTTMEGKAPAGPAGLWENPGHTTFVTSLIEILKF
jgi:hypothetical protein